MLSWGIGLKTALYDKTRGPRGVSDVVQFGWIDAVWKWVVTKGAVAKASWSLHLA